MQVPRCSGNSAAVTVGAVVHMRMQSIAVAAHPIGAIDSQRRAAPCRPCNQSRSSMAAAAGGPAESGGGGSGTTQGIAGSLALPSEQLQQLAPAIHAQQQSNEFFKVLRQIQVGWAAPLALLSSRAFGCACNAKGLTLVSAKQSPVFT